MMPSGGPGAPGWSGPWMTVSDVFHIRGRGTVVTGLLQGDVPLNIGDTLVCEGTRWEVSGLEQFRSTLMTAMPGSEIGVLLRKGPPGNVLRGQTVTFEPGTPGLGKRRWRS